LRFGEVSLTATDSSLARYLRRPLVIDRELAVLFAPEARLTIFDVGACEGEDSIRYQLRYPNARVYAFEPLAENAARARAHFAAYDLPSVTLVEIALSDSVGTASFHVSSGRPEQAPDPAWDYGNKSSSLLAPDKTLEVHEWLKFDTVTTVPTTTLREYCAANGIGEIDFMHLDVQGAELMVLAGAGPILTRIKAVWLEAEQLPLYRDQPLGADVERFMRSHGFVKIKDTLDRVSGDQLYMRPEFFSIWQRGRLQARFVAPGWSLRLARRLRSMLRRIR
jgi:FkbM family methyltransferase